MKAADIEDPKDINKIRGLGVIDLPTIQKKANPHYSLLLGLFGCEVSNNAANFYNAGLKGPTSRQLPSHGNTRAGPRCAASWPRPRRARSSA